MDKCEQNCDVSGCEETASKGHILCDVHIAKMLKAMNTKRERSRIALEWKHLQDERWP